MNSSTSAAFRKQLADLAPDVQRQARDPRVPKAKRNGVRDASVKSFKIFKRERVVTPLSLLMGKMLPVVSSSKIQQPWNTLAPQNDLPSNT